MKALTGKQKYFRSGGLSYNFCLAKIGIIGRDLGFLEYLCGRSATKRSVVVSIVRYLRGENDFSVLSRSKKPFYKYFQSFDNAE